MNDPFTPMTDLEQERADVLAVLCEVNAEWTQRRLMRLDMTKIEERIRELERKSRRLEEKIRKAEKRARS